MLSMAERDVAITVHAWNSRVSNANDTKSVFHYLNSMNA